MRLRHPDGSLLHLAYCSNVHPADDLDGVAAQLSRYTARVREKLDVSSLGVGLWVAAPAVADEAAASRLADELRRLRLEVVTLNGFPYKAFHAPVVKLDVYWPHWAQDARRDYTLGLAKLLSRLLPADIECGSVSTLPLGWREGWGDEEQAAALTALADVASELEALYASTGKKIRLALEPEPGCTVETITQACEALSGLAPEWIGVCLDACHLAVQFEEPAEALRRLADAGLPVVKLQASCAVEATDPADPAARRALRRLAEPRFLHQTRASTGGDVLAVDDLPDALDGALPTDTGPWRVHFHAPLHTDPEPPLRTTTDQLGHVLAGLLGGPSAGCDHIEVETYTWSVLPEPPADLAGGIAAELARARDRLAGLGLKEDHQ